MKRTPQAPVRVVSTDCTLVLSTGCHQAITETIHLSAGLPVSIPAEALAFVLSFPGVESVEAAPPEPATSEE
jgi:hypothetical protein